MRATTTATRDTTSDRTTDGGFTVVEVVVAVVLVAAVMASAGAFFLSGVATSATLQRRDAAAQVADEAMDFVRAVPATAGAAGVVALVEGRAQAAAEAHWDGAPAGLATITQPVWDGTVVADPVVPFTQTRSAGGIDYTVDTYIGLCRKQDDGTCTTAAGGVEHYRVVVRVSWTEGAGRTCSGDDCEFVVSTLVNGDEEPVFNPDAQAATPVAVDDAANVFLGDATVIDVLANDSGTFGATPVAVLSQPATGTVVVDPPTGRVTYTPTASGTDTFTYRLSGLLGDVSGTATVTVTVAAGAAADDAATVTYPASVTVDARANDTGVFRAGGVTIGTPVGSGTGAVTANQVVVTPTVAFPFAPTPTGSNLVRNGGFENAPTRVANARTLLTTLDGWTLTGGGSARFEIANGVDGGAPEGGNFSEVDTNGNVTLSQGLATTVGTPYRLTFRHRADPGVTQTSNGLRVSWGGSTVAELRHDGTGGASLWRQYSYDLPAATGASTALAFAGIETADTRGVWLDDVRVFALTPVPAALSTQNWTIAVPYTSTGSGRSSSATVRVTASPPPAPQVANQTICVPRDRNVRVSVPLASSVTTGVTPGATFIRTTTPDAGRWNTPEGPLLGDGTGTVTVETRGQVNGNRDDTMRWTVRDAWGRTSAEATVTLQLRNSC